MIAKHYGQALYEATVGSPKAEVAKAAKHLVELLAGRGQLGKINAVIAGYTDYYNKANQLVPVTVYSRHALSNDHQEEITKWLKKQLTGNLELTWQEDEAIIGGIKIVAGDKIIDGSILGSLTQLSEHLSK